MSTFAAPASYWISVVLWTAILAFYLRRLKQTYAKKLFFTLILILAIDAFRTLFESVYFGLWYSSLAGLLPDSLRALLIEPHMVLIPKAFNILAAVLIIVLLIKRWIPEEEQAKEEQNAALSESEERFRAFTSQSVDGIGVATMEGRYTYVNPMICTMMGYSEDELLTMSVFDLRGPSQAESVFEDTKEMVPDSPKLVYLQRKDGTEFLAEIVGKVIEHGDTSSVLGTVRDVTERERAAQERRSLEQQVQHGQKLESLGVLAGGIAHDFNNVLTAILGNAGLASLSLAEGSECAGYVREIELAATGAAGLTKQMLDYSGKGRFVVERVDPRALVEGIMQLLAVSVSKKIAVEYRFDEDTLAFDGDAAQIRQVVMNLITNASEAIGEDVGKIVLSTGSVECSRETLDDADAALHTLSGEPLAEGTFVFIEVQDTGCGMAEATQRKLFDPFFTTKFTGRGLGMSSVLGILRGHGAGIRVDSELGRGTTIRVLFPAAGAAVVEPMAPSSASPPTESLEHKLVLLADDEENVRKVGQRMLEHLGYSVLSAVDGEHALRLYREHASDIQCVLLDLTMPRMDGLEVFRAIRAMDPAMRVVLCSGYSEQDITERFEGDLPNGFLHKPYPLKKLKSMLRKALPDEDSA